MILTFTREGVGRGSEGKIKAQRGVGRRPLTEKLTFEQKLKGGEGRNPAVIWNRSFRKKDLQGQRL